jgi:hypothetical protein
MSVRPVARALGDELQHPIEVRHPAERARDLGGRLEPADDALQVVVAAPDVAIQARIRDRDGRPVREDRDRFFIVVRELAVGLLGQVQVAPCLSVHDDRHAEEAVHRGVREREAVGLRMRADVLEPERPRFADQHAEHPAPARQVADRTMRVLVDPPREEPLELLTAVVEHADRGVSRAGQLDGDRQQLIEHGLWVQLRDQGAADVE